MKKLLAIVMLGIAMFSLVGCVSAPVQQAKTNENGEIIVNIQEVEQACRFAFDEVAK